QLLANNARQTCSQKACTFILYSSACSKGELKNENLKPRTVNYPLEQAEEGVIYEGLSARMFEQITLFVICEFRSSLINRD
ncbi:MAG: hypothetical protein OQL09_04195, partial [Gammaproteobacteria bacterium]|nr:hypothetical protein [Gammaproteobacteria bacterium]